jgi:hypothetical protein
MTARDLCKEGSDCWRMLEAEREARELGSAVGEGRERARKPEL